MVRLKWGMEYKGYLVSTDNYMNLQVSSLEGVSLSLVRTRLADPCWPRLTLPSLRCDLPTQLANTEEYQEGASVGSLGEVFIRCVASFSRPQLAAHADLLLRACNRCNNVLQCVSSTPSTSDREADLPHLPAASAAQRNSRALTLPFHPCRAPSPSLQNSAGAHLRGPIGLVVQSCTNPSNVVLGERA